MKRSEFLRRLGIGAAAAVVAPKALAEGLGKEEVVNSPFDQEKIKERIEFLRRHPYCAKDSFKVSGSEMSTINIKWTEDGKYWYYAT